MESLEALEAHRRGLSRLVPILEAVRSIAELAWRDAQRGFPPLEAYAERVRMAFESLAATLTRDERAALAPRDRLPVGLLFIGSERGLCGPFNERLVAHGLRHALGLMEAGTAIRYLCLGRRGARVLEAAGVTLLYTRGLTSLSIPAYVDIQEIAMDLLDLTGSGAFGQLLTVHNALAGRFEYAPTVRSLLPPPLPPARCSPARSVVIPAGDTPVLLTHLMTEHVLVDLFRRVRESAISEQLARIYTMRLAADNARRLVDDLAARCALVRRNAITDSLLETVAGYEAAVNP